MWAFVATALSSGLVAGLVSFFLALRRDHHLSRQQKAEQLFRSADRWHQSMIGFYVGMLSIVKGGGTMNDGVSLADKDAGSAQTEARMLIAFYFPEVSPAWEELNRVRSVITNVLIKCEKNEAQFRDYDAAVALWEPAAAQLFEAITLEGQKYSSFEPWKMIKFKTAPKTNHP